MGEGLFLTGELELDFRRLGDSLLGEGLLLTGEPELDLRRLGDGLLGEVLLLTGDCDLDLLTADLFGDSFLLGGESDSDFSLLCFSFLSLL